jgi:hypothetical protein
MTTEELQRCAREAFDYGVATILRTGQLHMQFHLVKRDGGVEFVIADDSVTNNEGVKAKLAQELRERAKKGELVAIIHLSDSYFAEVTPMKDKIREELGLTVKQAADAGLIEAREAVMCILQSSILRMHLQQEYRRREDDTCELVGEPIILSDADGTLGKGTAARFNGLFAEARTA